MNEIIKALHARKSIRVFADMDISTEEKHTIIEAAMAAPSAGCQQMYSIIDITDPEIKLALSKSCDNQPFIAKAPMALVFCGDYQKWYDAFCQAGCNPRKPRAGEFALAMQDTLIAAQNAVTAAESLGIGSCYIGDIMEHCEYHRRLLNLPEYVFPATLLVFGYPTEQQKNRPKPQRCSVDDILHENIYKRYDPTGLEKLFSHRCLSQTFDEFMQAFCNRKYMSDFSIEMSDSVEKYLHAYMSGGEDE